jgi:hypothetical protein
MSTGGRLRAVARAALIAAGAIAIELDQVVF